MNRATNKNYLLTVLLLVLASTFVDRYSIGLVLQDIKTDLSLSDTQLGVLTGIAFAIFYAGMGIPIARWADRGNRVTIMSVTSALLGFMVILCALAANFWQLLLARIGCAVGEAGCMPTAHSLIADRFSRAERPRAVARFMLGVPLSLIVGYFVAGWLNEYYGWRTMFAALGIPALILAAIVRWTLNDPRSSSLDDPSYPKNTAERSTTPIPSIREVLRVVWQNVTFRRLLMSSIVVHLFAVGMSQWKPAFFVRSFEMATGELGTWFAVLYGGVGLFGTYIGGELASRYAVHNERLQLRVMGIGYALIPFIYAWMFLSTNKYVALGLLGLENFVACLMNGPLFAVMQTLIPDRMRAMSIALVFFLGNLIGMGLGPLAAGALSDALRPEFGDESLRYSLLMLCPGYLWGAWYKWRASQSVTTDLQAQSPSNPTVPRIR